MPSKKSAELLRLTIAAVRAQTRETQADLAAGIGLSQGQLSRKLRNTHGTAWTLDDVDRLAAHWRMRPLDLLAGPTHALERLNTTAPAPNEPSATPSEPASPTPQTPAHPPTPSHETNPASGQAPALSSRAMAMDQQAPPNPPPALL